MAQSIPNLPGMIPNYPIEKNVQPTIYPLPRYQPQQNPDESKMFNPNYMSTTHDVYKPKHLSSEIKDNSSQFQPDYVKMDRHTLRFYGYFKESCVESALEAARVRNVTIYFYLDDNTVEVIEPKQQNSGIPQGQLLRKQKVLKADKSGHHIGVDDFAVGGDVEIFGKNVHLYDCDLYTREFYENLGRPQGLPESAEEDNWGKKTYKPYVPKKDHSLREYKEHMLGGGKVNSAKQFLENDRKVLRFYAFSQIPYLIHFFLADDTIEIKEINFQNSGRDPFPQMLRRQKLPRKFALNQPGQTYAEEFIKDQDIKANDYLDVYGRKFFIQGCDLYTQKYYQEKFNVDFPFSEIEQQKVAELPEKQIPPYNGFGNEDDSLGYVYRLIPKPPKKDFFKWVDNQVNLRFVARLNTKQPEDVDRRYVLTFFLNDDTIQIFEPSVRNSGIPDGKFLERGKYKNSKNNNQFFQPTDLIIGNDILINQISFNIMDCDEFTKKWWSQHMNVK